MAISDAEQIEPFLDQIVREESWGLSPGTLSRDEVVSRIGRFFNYPTPLEAKIHFEEWEPFLRAGIVRNDRYFRYNMYSENLVIEQLPTWTQIERTAEIRLRNLRSEISGKLRTINPSEFEMLIVTLLSRVRWAKSIVITGKSHDGGIDFKGIYIAPEHEFELLMFGQAKQWNAKVGSPVVDAFMGSIGSKAKGRPCIGVLVGLGGFTEEAIKKTKESPVRIIMFDERRVIEQMMRYDVGVKRLRLDAAAVDEQFWQEIKRVD